MTKNGENCGAKPTEAVIFNIQRFCLHDGPGIRTTVFSKGCGLHCQWCDNPESISQVLELGFASVSCNRCGKCVAGCGKNAISIASDGMPRIDRRQCDACGDCVSVCIPEALTVYGKRRSVEEVFRDVLRDKDFFPPDGGVTVSGGDPLWWSPFVVALFKLCRDAGIPTALETSGFAPTGALKEVLTCVDLVMFDLKHMDTERHRQLTGQPNGRVLSNARLLAGSPAKVQFRMPLIPGLNSEGENIRATAAFLKDLQKEEASVELMPYHRLGIGKYKALDRIYCLNEVPSATPDFVESVRQSFEMAGVRCLVSK
ncbi:MAG: glycyl-radical enzyme activating protein [Chloroflexi bacterium]|nr:glycyl-radical enzyme activating protein [Chloroflexota bacterium]